jgi:hypothetical protein
LSNLLFRACQALLYDWEEIINKKISTVGKLNASVSTHPLPVNSTALTFQRCPPVLPLSALDASETGRCWFLPRTCVLLPCWTLGSRTVSAALRESGFPFPSGGGAPTQQPAGRLRQASAAPENPMPPVRGSPKIRAAFVSPSVANP